MTHEEARPNIRDRVAKIQRLRREYEDAMLNEDMDSYGDLLDAVKAVLVELGYPPLISNHCEAIPQVDDRLEWELKTGLREEDLP